MAKAERQKQRAAAKNKIFAEHVRAGVQLLAQFEAVPLPTLRVVQLNREPVQASARRGGTTFRQIQLCARPRG